MRLIDADAVHSEIEKRIFPASNLDAHNYNVGINDALNEIEDGKMVFDWFPWEKDGKEIPKIHPTQKPVALLKRLIELFTDPGDVVIDPCAGSGSTLRAAMELGRKAYGFEVSKAQYQKTVSSGILDYHDDPQMRMEVI